MNQLTESSRSDQVMLEFILTAALMLMKTIIKILKVGIPVLLYPSPMSLFSVLIPRIYVDGCGEEGET